MYDGHERIEIIQMIRFESNDMIFFSWCAKYDFISGKINFSIFGVVNWVGPSKDKLIIQYIAGGILFSFLVCVEVLMNFTFYK